MTTQQLKGEEIVLTKRDKTYKFLFQLISKDEMLIKAKQEQKEKDKIIPASYQKLLTINDLPKREGMAITNMKVALDLIESSSKTNTLDFDLEEKKKYQTMFLLFRS